VAGDGAGAGVDPDVVADTVLQDLDLPLQAAVLDLLLDAGDRAAADLGDRQFAGLVHGDRAVEGGRGGRGGGCGDGDRGRGGGGCAAQGQRGAAEGEQGQGAGGDGDRDASDVHVDQVRPAAPRRALCDS
jgi:hypothetical protein